MSVEKIWDLLAPKLSRVIDGNMNLATELQADLNNNNSTSTPPCQSHSATH
jgi:hypothetical protein